MIDSVTDARIKILEKKVADLEGQVQSLLKINKSISSMSIQTNKRYQKQSDTHESQ